MIIPKRTFDASLFMETSVLRETSLPSRDSQQILLRMLPRQVPGWGVQYRSSHSLHNTLKHLVLKGLYQDLNKRENQLLQLLGAGVNSLWFELIKQLFQLSEKENQWKKIWYPEVLKFEEFSLLEPYGRFLQSFEPRLTVSKFWVEPVRLPPKRYIGKGHNDGGSLGSGPSWKELMSPDEEEILEGEVERLREIFGVFHQRINRHSSLDPSTSDGIPNRRAQKRAKRVKKEDK